MGGSYPCDAKVPVRQLFAGASFRLIRRPGAADTSGMQRVCEVRGGVSAYLRDPDMLDTAESRKCPYCAGAHAMGLHGWYFRQVILPAGGGCQRIPISGDSVSIGRSGFAAVTAEIEPRRRFAGCLLASILSRPGSGPE